VSDIKILSFDENYITLDFIKSFLDTSFVSFLNLNNLSHIPFIYSFSQSKSSKIPTSNYYQHFYSSSSREISSLNPIATRFVGKNNYIERPPFKASIKYREKDSSSSPFEFSLWIPWSIFYFSNNYSYLESCNVYFSHQQLSSYDDLYVSSIYPNIFDDSRICFGNSFSDYLQKLDNENTSTLFSSYINYFFSGIWNNDISPITPSFIESVFSFQIIPLQNIIDDYPLIYSYATFDKEFIESRLRSLNSQTMNNHYQYITEKDLFNLDNYIYYLFFLSLLNLDETLDFVNQFSLFNKHAISLDKHRYLSYVPSFSTFGEIVSSLEDTAYNPDYSDYWYISSSITDFFHPGAIDSASLNISHDYCISYHENGHTFIVLQKSDSISGSISHYNYNTYYTQHIDSQEFMNLFHDLYRSKKFTKAIHIVEFDGSSYSLIKSIDLSLNSFFDSQSRSYYNSINYISSILSNYFSSSDLSFVDFEDFSIFLTDTFNQDKIHV
jgi:hypothetical protein